MAEKTPAQKEAQKRYMEKFAVARVRMTADKLLTVKSHAAAKGESLNEFLNRAIKETMQRDNEKPGE